MPTAAAAAAAVAVTTAEEADLEADPLYGELTTAG